MFNKNNIKEDKLKYRNKVEKANRLNNTTINNLIDDVNTDFFNDIEKYLEDFKSVCEDYKDLYKYMRELDKFRKSSLVSLKVQHKEEMDAMQREYDLLLEENKELLEFKKKFTQEPKVNKDVILKVKELKAQGLTHAKVSEIVGVSSCTITKIMKGKYDNKGLI